MGNKEGNKKSLTKSGNLSATYLFGDAVSSFFVATTLSIIWRQKEIPLRHFWWWQWNVFSSNNANFLSPYFSPSSTKRWSWKGIKIRRVENQYPIIYYYKRQLAAAENDKKMANLLLLGTYKVSQIKGVNIGSKSCTVGKITIFSDKKTNLTQPNPTQPNLT